MVQEKGFEGVSQSLFEGRLHHELARNRTCT